MHLPCDAEGNNDVVAFTKRKIAKLTLERASAIVNPPGFIRLRVAIKIVHAVFGARYTENDIVVAEEWNPRGDRIRSERSLGGFEGAVADGSEVHIFRFCRSQILGLLYPRREEIMIKNRLDGRETFQSHR